MNAITDLPDHFEAADLEQRPATAHMNYRRHVVVAIREVAERGLAMGPTTMREPLYPVSAVYDPETGRTRVGFSYLAPPESPNARLQAALAAIRGGAR